MFEQDIEKAKEWYEKAAQKGNVDAMFDLSQLLIFRDGGDEDICRGFDLLEEAAKGDCSEAAFAYGALCLTPGALSSVRDRLDVHKGIEFLQNACAKEHGPSEHMLGCAYMKGIGVEKDLDKARTLFNAALEHGGLLEDEIKDIEKALVKLNELDTQE